MFHLWNKPLQTIWMEIISNFQKLDIWGGILSLTALEIETGVLKWQKGSQGLNRVPYLYVEDPIPNSTKCDSAKTLQNNRYIGFSVLVARGANTWWSWNTVGLQYMQNNEILIFKNLNIAYKILWYFSSIRGVAIK